MTIQICNKEEHGYDWIDINCPDDGELQEIAAAYGLHPALVHDCLQPGHLPKYESLEEYAFIIFRVYTDQEFLEADTVQELTNKVAIFYSASFFITIHRYPQPLLEPVIKRASMLKNTHQLLNGVARACLATYDEPSNDLAKSIDYYEEQVFLSSRNKPILKGLYYLRRRIDLLKRMLMLSRDIIENIDDHQGNVNTRDTRDLYVRLTTIYESLNDNINQLLNTYFSTASQRTNETMRVLTIFSVFFMPLTFIVGIYGMNFKYMPELQYPWAYPGVLLLMAAITVAIYYWFRRKRWL
ncbi:MAG: CorA family divalent cation transporter [Arcticibacter sp.]